MRNPIKFKYTDGEGCSQFIRWTGNEAMTDNGCSNKCIASNMINDNTFWALQDKVYKQMVKKIEKQRWLTVHIHFD